MSLATRGIPHAAFSYFLLRNSYLLGGLLCFGRRMANERLPDAANL